MIDDLWWYGDTMWYVYIIDIYRYPSVCVCECRSNMFQSSRWLSLNVVRQLKRKIIFFLQFLCRVSHFRSITEFRTSFCCPIPQDTLADGEPFEVSDLPFPEVNSPGNCSSWNDSSRVTPGVQMSSDCGSFASCIKLQLAGHNEEKSRDPYSQSLQFLLQLQP